MTDNPRPHLSDAKAVANRKRKAAERDRNAKLSELWDVINDVENWPYSGELHNALTDRLVGHQSKLLQEWHDSGEGTLEEKNFVAAFRRAWDPDGAGPLFRARGRSTGVHSPLDPVISELVKWVRAERAKEHRWRQTKKLPDGKFNEIFERAFERFPDAARLHRKEYIRRLIDIPNRPL